MTDLSPLTTINSLYLRDLPPGIQASLTSEGEVKPTGQGAMEGHADGYVYVVSARGWSIPRAVGHSTILYVGQSSDKTRVKGLASKTSPHSACAALQRLHWALRPGGEKPLDVWVHVVKTKTPIVHECLALNRIVLEHGEMPPANSRWERWLSTRVVQHLATGQGNDNPPFWTTGPHFEGDHGASKPAAWSTWFHVYTQSPGPKGGEDADWIGAVGWAWTSSKAKLRGKLLLAANEGADLQSLGNADELMEKGLAKQLWGADGAGCEVFVLPDETGVLGWEQHHDKEVIKAVLEKLFGSEDPLRSRIQAFFRSEAKRGRESDKTDG
mgnify:FL=1